MTPHEKAINAVNARLERLQANLSEAKGEATQQFLFQSLLVTIGAAEALNDYITVVGKYAQRRHAEVKKNNEALAAQHAEFLTSGQELLEKLKANPTDRALRKEIEVAQQKMSAIQKNLRRGTNALQRELAPSLGLIDEMAVSVRRFSETDQSDGLKRVLRTMIGQVRELFGAQLGVAARDVMDAAAWEKSAAAEVERGADFYDAYARAGFQAILAIELMALVLADNPPQSAAEVTQRGNEAVVARLKTIAARFSETSAG